MRRLQRTPYLHHCTINYIYHLHHITLTTSIIITSYHHQRHYYNYQYCKYPSTDTSLSYNVPSENTPIKLLCYHDNHHLIASLSSHTYNYHKKIKRKTIYHDRTNGRLLMRRLQHTSYLHHCTIDHVYHLHCITFTISMASHHHIVLLYHHYIITRYKFWRSPYMQTYIDCCTIDNRYHCYSITFTILVSLHHHSIPSPSYHY